MMTSTQHGVQIN